MDTTSTTTVQCNFCGEFGHSNNQCNHDELHDVWTHIVNMVGHHSEWNDEAFTFQKRFLQHNVPHHLVIAIAIRFCNLEYSYNATFDDIIYSIYNGLNLVYSEMENEEEISEMLNQSIEIVDPDEDVPIQWKIEPLLLCLETADELKEELLCSICLDNHTKLSMVITNCGHEFGKTCMCSHLDHQISNNRNPTCPLCRTEVRTLEIKDVEFYDELYERYVTAPSAEVPLDIPNDLESVSDIAFLDSFVFMPQSVF
jgi:hypothetical protein